MTMKKQVTEELTGIINESDDNLPTYTMIGGREVTLNRVRPVSMTTLELRFKIEGQEETGAPREYVIMNYCLFNDEIIG